MRSVPLRDPRFIRSMVGGLTLGLLLAATTAAMAASPEARPVSPDAKDVGHRYAPGLMSLLEQEILSALDQRGLRGNMASWYRYAASRLNATAGPYTGSEITGNCRLRWYDQMLRSPLKYPAESEQFTRELHEAMLSDHRGLEQALITARAKLDAGSRKAREFAPVKSAADALDTVKQALEAAQTGYAGALSTLTKREIQELWNNLYSVTTAQSQIGHTLPDRYTARRMCDLLEKIRRDRMLDAVDALVPLTDPELLKQLGGVDATRVEKLAGVEGSVVQQFVTPAGKVIVGGKGRNTYRLEELKDVAAVIDLGGEDTYQEGACNIERPLLVLIDLSGNDVYQATRPGVQGGAVLGISMLLDVDGDDTYQAADVAQAACLGGAGILIDYAGNDRYYGVRRLQGAALGGVALLIDRRGSDDYHAAMWAQGYGGPLGFGVLDDLDGKDHYYVGGLYRNSYYPETPGYEGWGQGVGVGIRQSSCGGIGVILDGGGDDDYEFDYMSHGGGYWLALGFARDFGGNDRRLGATAKAFNGGPRTQESFQRFGNGFGCHYALGICIDDQGNDSYNGTIMGLGFGWDLSLGALCDFGGNDRYEATGGGTQGNGAQGSIGIIFEYDGDDVYLGYGQAFANTGITYHPASECGGNFSFVIDYGGKDSYGCGAQNDSYNRRGGEGGFLIDRPRREPNTREASKNPIRPAVAGS